MNISSVFIGGLDRSGKTYLRFMLESHPEFIFSKRTNLWPKYFQRFGRLDDEQNQQRCLDALADNKHILALEPDFDLIRKEFLKGPATYQRLFEIIHLQTVRKQQKSIWGDQTEFLEYYAAGILSAYPQAKFLQLMRDPRDRYEAILEKSGSRKGIGVATTRWISSVELAKKNQANFPERYKIIRYETMVTDPEKTMLDVCNFLEVQYYPTMVALEDIPRFDREVFPKGEQNLSPLSVEYIGRFQKKLSVLQIAFIQKYASRYMPWHNYSLVPTRFSFQEWITFHLLFWPFNLLQMITWGIRSKLVRMT